MCVLIPVDISDFLHTSRHLAISAQIIKKHEAGIKVNPLKDKICNTHPKKTTDDVADSLMESLGSLNNLYIMANSH